MKRALVTLLAAALMALTAAPALAQATREQEPEEPTKVEPAYSLFVSEYAIIVDGERADAFRAGSDARLRLTLTNSGEERARNISLVLKADPKNATLEILDGRATVADLAPGDSGDATFTVRAHEPDCVTDSTLMLDMTSSLGSREEYVGGQVLCPGPNVYYGEIRYVGGDDDGVAEPGERLKVFVTLHNYGRDAATDVIARIKIDNPDVTVIEGNGSWPNIKPGESAEVSAPFVIQIADDAKVQENGCGSYGGGAEPARANEPVTSEPEQIVTDEQAARDAEGGSEPGSTSTGSSGSTGSEPAGKPEPVPADEPASEPYVEPDPSVAFDAQMTVTASGKDFESGFGTQMYCLMESEGRPASDGAARGGDDSGPVELDAGIDLGLPMAKSSPTRTTHVATAGALLALVAGGLLFRRSLLSR